MPRGAFAHHPDLSVFEVCGVREWTSKELDTYVGRLRRRWTLRNGVQ
jgi:hypothetical protein